MEIVYEEDSDTIKTFLKIGQPKIEEKPYYDVDLEKNVILLHDPIFKNKSDNSSLFELNQIFTDKNEYSYIYEQICQNTVSEALNGESFVFISYGITTSDKLQMLIGNIENSHRNSKNAGILPRLLEQLINAINNNKQYKDNLSINLSYLCIYDNKLIDLSNYFGKNFSNYSVDNFTKDGLSIETVEIIKRVKKVPTENNNDVLFFINKLLLHFRKLEDDSNGELFSKSYFAVIVYITNNEGKNISKLTFILLNGSEQLNSDKQNKLDKGYVNTKESKRILNYSKLALDTQYTYNSILNAIKNNEYIIGKKREKNKLNEENLDLIEEKNLSKLTKVLFYPCFNRKLKNIKFIIIGSIMPLPGLHSSVKDTLLYLFECRKIKSNITQNIKNYSKKFTFQKDNHEDVIFNLEEKVKLQEKKIADLHNQIEKKELNIAALEKNYKEQVKILKDYFGFSGDINILLSGHEFSKEMRNAREIKESIDIVKRLKIKIKDLEGKLQKANEEIKRYNNINEIKINNDTMINYYFSVKKIEEEKKNKENDLHIKLKQYQNELKIKNKIIQELKNDLDKKNDILLNMPKYLQDLQEKKIEEKEKMEKAKEEQKKEILDDNSIVDNKNENNKKIKKMDYLMSLKNKDKEINEMKKKYDNIINQKDKIIFDINNELNYLKDKNGKIFNKYEEELYKLNDLFLNLINNYQRIFLSNFTEKCSAVTIYNKKLQYDQILCSIKKEYNMFSFPILYKMIEKKGKLNLTNFNTSSLRKASKEYNQAKIGNQKLLLINYNQSYINFNENSDLFDKNNFNDINSKNLYLNSINQIILYLNEQIKANNIILNKEEIEKLNKERIIEEYEKTVKLISKLEEYIHKILKKIENQFKIEGKQKNKEYENKINDYKNQVLKISNNLDKEISLNNKNKIIINSQNRLIEKLQQDLIFKEIPDYKMKLSKKINRKINLAINKNNDYPNLIDYNKSFDKSKKNYRAISSKIRDRRIETEGSSALTSFIKKTNSYSSLGINNNNTFIKDNTPIIISTEENMVN